MSWETTGWAMETGRKAGKALPAPLRWLLVCVADRCNRDTGYTFVSPRKLAADHGNSVDWVKGALRQLEQMGLLARVRRLKPDGSHDTSLLILLCDDEARERAAQLGWSKPLADDEADESAEEGVAAADETQDVGGVGVISTPPPHPGGRGDLPPQGGGDLDPTHIDEPGSEPSIPQPPSRVAREAAPASHPPQAVVPAATTGLSGGMPDGWHPDRDGADAFLASWEPKTAADLPETVRRCWSRLSAEERRQAVGRLADWRMQMRRESKRYGTATAYLRNKAWQVLDHVRAGRRDGSAAAVFWVRHGTPEWEAWERHWAREGRRLVAIPSKHETGHGWHMPSLWPPRAGAAGGAAGGLGDADRLARSHADFAAANGI